MKIFYIFILNIVSFNLCGQTVDFEWSSVENLYCAPQVVTFKNTSSGNPNSLVWKFGNGKTGNLPVENVIYTNSGTFEVMLIAIYGDLALTTTKTITINPTPSINISSNKTELCKAGEVSFSATGGNNITNYVWNFGDNTSPVSNNENRITHNFTDFNNYNVTVTGKNQFGCYASASKIIKINTLVASATISKTSGCIPVTPMFRLSAAYLSEDRLSQAIWDFGDGTVITDNNNNITHTYTTTNDITTANVKIISNMGCEATVNLPKFAFGVPPTNLFIKTEEPKDSFCSSEKIKFIATATNANYFVWNYGTSNTDSINGNDATHRFRVLGDNTIQVTPYMNGCVGRMDSIHLFIKGVVAGYNVKNTCNEKNNFTFPSKTKGNVSHIQWTYGGNFNSVIDTNSINGAFSFPQVGSNFVDLLVVDDITACRDSLRTDIFTGLPELEVNKNSVCKDSLIIYTVRGDYPSEAKFKYLYNVNGQTINNGNSDTLAFNPSEHGIFNDFLVIKDNFSGTCDDTLHLNGPIKVMGPVVQFDAPGLLCFDTLVNLTNNSYPYFPDEPIENVNWDFGNGTQSNATTPAPFNYNRFGKYNISLTVTDGSGCSQKLIKPITINPLPKVDILPGHDTVCLGETIQLIAYSSDSISWMNNAGINCLSCDTINIRPTTSTNYIVNAISKFGCRNFDNSLIKVYEPINLKINPTDTTLCAGEKFQYAVNSPGIILWQPETGLSSTTSLNPVATAISDIEYKVILKDSVGCFSDSAMVKLKVNQLPIVNAGPDKVLSFDDLFILSPTYSPGIISFNWSESETLNCLSCPTPSGRMKWSESLSIKVKDINGCKAEDKINLILDCSTSTLMVPNAFTPNGDGLNDYFFPLSKGYEEIKNFSVYDRSGHKVFERSNFTPNQKNLGWDGLVNGVQPNTQTYVWMAQVYCQGNLITKKGIVTLIR